jgi:hypothetical protein
MTQTNGKPSDWDDPGFPGDDNIKKGQLQAIIRRYAVPLPYAETF